MLPSQVRVCIPTLVTVLRIIVRLGANVCLFVFLYLSLRDFYRLQWLQTLPSTKVEEAVEGVALLAQSAAKEVR